MSNNEESTTSGEEESRSTEEELLDSDSEREMASKPEQKLDFNKNYLMKCPQRPRLGQAVIFNNQNFDDPIRK